MGARARDGRRNAREAHPDSAAAARDRDGGSAASPRAVPAKPPGATQHTSSHMPLQQELRHDCGDALGAQRGLYLQPWHLVMMSRDMHLCLA